MMKNLFLFTMSLSPYLCLKTIIIDIFSHLTLSDIKMCTFDLSVKEVSEKIVLNMLFTFKKKLCK